MRKSVNIRELGTEAIKSSIGWQYICTYMIQMESCKSINIFAYRDFPYSAGLNKIYCFCTINDRLCVGARAHAHADWNNILKLEKTARNQREKRYSNKFSVVSTLLTNVCPILYIYLALLVYPCSPRCHCYPFLFDFIFVFGVIRLMA